MATVLKKLSALYPTRTRETLSSVLKKVLFISAFILIINLVNDLDRKNLPTIIIFNVVTFLVLLFNLIGLPRLFPYLFIEEKWTVWKQILWILFQLFSIATLNFLFFALVGISVPNIPTYLNFVGTTIGLGIGPVVAIVLFEQNRLLRANLRQANVLNKKIRGRQKITSDENIIEIKSSLANQNFPVDKSEIVFIQASDNYVLVNYLEEGTIKSKIIRTTLKKVEEQLSQFHEFIRCHRAYIINMSYVIHVNGNAQGLKLSLDKYNYKIPVSRNYVKRIREILP